MLRRDWLKLVGGVIIANTGHACNHDVQRQTPDKVIPMCRYASQATQKMAHTLEKLCNDGKANAHMREPRLSPLLPLQIDIDIF